MPDRMLLFMGMKPDRRIFRELLPLLPDATVVDWIEPLPRESLVAYARRLAGTLSERQQERLIVAGVSFGGVVAQEVAACLSARACVVISSICSPAQLPPWQRSIRPLARMGGMRVLDAIGSIAGQWPASLRSGSTVQLAKFAGPANRWRRWAMTALMQWSPTPHAVPTLHIHGDQDMTFPIQFVRPHIVIHGGGHLLPLTHPQEIASAIREFGSNFDRLRSPR